MSSNSSLLESYRHFLSEFVANEPLDRSVRLLPTEWVDHIKQTITALISVASPDVIKQIGYRHAPLDMTLPHVIMDHCADFLSLDNNTKPLVIPVTDSLSSLILVNKNMNHICTNKRYSNIQDRFISFHENAVLDDMNQRSFNMCLRRHISDHNITNITSINIQCSSSSQWPEIVNMMKLSCRSIKSLQFKIDGYDSLLIFCAKKYIYCFF